MRTLRLSDGQPLAYEEAGGGEPLLLVMGTGADHSFWSAQVAALSSRYRVITFDSRGTGQSGRFERIEDCTPASLARDAAELLEALDAGPAHVAGLSLGSCVAQELALARADLVSSLGLHGTWGRSDEWFVRMIETLEMALRHEGLRGFIRCATTWILSPAYHAEHAEAVCGVEERFADEPDPARLRERLHGILAHCHADRVHDAQARLGAVRVPTLVTAGELDIQVPSRYGRAVAEAIPGAAFHLFTGPGSSHCACLEVPGEWSRVSLDFLRGVARR